MLTLTGIDFAVCPGFATPVCWHLPSSILKLDSRE